MALVVPSRGKAEETARLLLELADSVWDVKTTTEHGGDMGVAFLVPDDLHDRYLDALNQPEAGEEDKPAPKRKGGRPRKAVQQSDTAANDEEDEE